MLQHNISLFCYHFTKKNIDAGENGQSKCLRREVYGKYKGIFQTYMQRRYLYV